MDRKVSVIEDLDGKMMGGIDMNQGLRSLCMVTVGI